MNSFPLSPDEKTAEMKRVLQMFALAALQMNKDQVG